MKQGLVLVEGYTEERFVNTCRGPYLAAKGLWLTTTVVTTNATIGGPHAKGGVTRYGKVRRELREFSAAGARRSSRRCLTTMRYRRTSQVWPTGLPGEVLAQASNMSSPRGQRRSTIETLRSAHCAA